MTMVARARWVQRATMSRFILLVALSCSFACKSAPCRDARCSAIDGATDADPSEDAAIDAEDAAIDVHVGPSEVCTSSSDGSSPADEDLDDAIDEGCPWHVGVPHELVFADTHLSFRTSTIRLADEGRSLYYAGYHADPSLGTFTRVARRPSVGEPFTTRHNLALEASQILSVLEDELGAIGFVSGTTWLYDRATTTAPFEQDRALLATAVEGAFLAPSGLEVWYASSGTVYRARRTTHDEAFGTPEPIALGSEAAYAPMLSADGHTIFFQRGSLSSSLVMRIFIAQRDNRETTTFSAPTELPIPSTDALMRAGAPYYSQSTRELFFVGGGLSSNTLYRAEICRDGPCPSRVIDCPSPGVRGTDGIRCFELTSTPATFDQAVAACASATPFRHLATTQTPTTDRANVWSAFSGSAPFFIGYHDRATEGIFASVSGERETSLGTVSGDGPAGSEDCATLDPDSISGVTNGAPDDADCAVPLPYVCETEIWPTW